MKNLEEKFDIAIIGGGPAGMMAGIKAGESGASVIIIEKNSELGKKLLLTGGGRCNITNAEFNIKKLTSLYGKNGNFLFNAFFLFGPKELISFFESKNVRTKVERGKRVFPANDRAKTILKALISSLKEKGVKVLVDAEVHRISCKDKKIKKIFLKNGGVVLAEKYIITTGGLSYKETGSTGSGLRWAKQVGHKIEETKPSLVPLKIREPWVKELQGLALKNVKIIVKLDNKKKIEKIGEALFTHFGLSGPIILQTSREIGKMLQKGEVKIVLDLKPGLEKKALKKRIENDFYKSGNRLFKNSLNDLLPNMIIPLIIDFSKIDPQKKVNEITKNEKNRLAEVIKNIEMTVEDLMGFKFAIVTSGGVSLGDIDSKTMKSRIIDNLFFAGEIIDIDGPTGGFNLQASFSTGYLAGKSAADEVK